MFVEAVYVTLGGGKKPAPAPARAPGRRSEATPECPACSAASQRVPNAAAGPAPSSLVLPLGHRSSGAGPAGRRAADRTRGGARSI